MYWSDVYASDARARVEAEERAYANIKRTSAVHYAKKNRSAYRTRPQHKTNQPSLAWRVASATVEGIGNVAGGIFNKITDPDLRGKAAATLAKPATSTKLMIIVAAALIIATLTSFTGFASSIPETQAMPDPQDIPAAEAAEIIEDTEAAEEAETAEDVIEDAVIEEMPESEALTEASAYVYNGIDDIDHSELWGQITAEDFTYLDLDEKVELIGAMAHDDELRTGIPAEITAAQMILESGWMESDLTQDYNNCFGIKSSSEGYNWEGSTWYGDVAHMTTQEEYEPGEITTVVDGFRVYDSVWDSVCDHSAYLLNSGLYPGIDRPGLTAAEAVVIIQDGGYATGNDYGDEILHIIEVYGLERFGV